MVEDYLLYLHVCLLEVQSGEVKETQDDIENTNGSFGSLRVQLASLDTSFTNLP